MLAPALVSHVGGSGTETLREMLRSWERAPLLVVLLTLVTVTYVRALRSTTPGHGRRVGRLAAWLGAMVTLVVALGSPVDALGAHLVSAHMVQHMLLGDIAPALAAVALTGGVGVALARTFSIVPFTLVARVARRVPIIVVVCVWASTWGVWHTTWAYELALRSAPVHMLEHVSLFVVGTWLWTVIVDPMARHADREAWRIGAGVAALFFGAVLTNTLTYVDEPSYPAMAGNAERLLGWSSTVDQQAAGLVMLGVQSLTLGFALAWLIRRHLAASVSRRDPASMPGAHPLGW